VKPFLQQICSPTELLQERNDRADSEQSSSLSCICADIEQGNIFAAGRLITFSASALLRVQSNKGHGQRATASMLLCPICERYFV
jgi:hypothetical protein